MFFKEHVKITYMGLFVHLQKDGENYSGGWLCCSSYLHLLVGHAVYPYVFFSVIFFAEGQNQVNHRILNLL